MLTATDFFEPAARNWRARLAVSVDVMRELSRYSDPDEMYAVFARRMNQLYPTARQVSVSRRGLDAPEYRVTRFNLWKDRVNPYREAYRLPVFAGGVLAEVAHADEPTVIDDLDVSDADPAAEFLDNQRSLLAIPVYEHGVGATTVVVTREEPGAFAREQIPELVWMTNLFGRAVQTQVLSDQLRDACRTADYELKVIADLQHSLLPAGVPAVPGLDVAAHYRTANRAGGDYYDFFPLPDGRFGVLIADVSGHGSPAAVLMAITHSLAHSYPDSPARPGEFLGHLNAHLAGRYVGTTGHFVTAFYAVFDVARDELTYANAGHGAPRFAAAGSPGWKPLPTDERLPLGVSGGPAVYPEHRLRFCVGDKVALFTDGLTDALDKNGDPFGPHGLDRNWNTPLATAADIVRRVLGELDRFTGGVPADDDRTLVVVGRV